MNRYIRLLILGIVLSSTNVASIAAPRFCDDETAKLVSRAYVLSFPLLGQDSVLQELINANRIAFSEKGAATNCMRVLGSALINQSLAQHKNDNPYAAQERFGGLMPEGLESLPGQVDASMRSAGLEFFTMGQELLWLAEVLPIALEGNAGPYNAQGTQWRQTMLSKAPQLSMLCMMDASACQLFAATMNSMAPIAEQQVYLLATGGN